MYATFSTAAVVLSLLVGSSHGFWRLSCGIVQTGRIDPIVTPGKLSSHAHKIAGASNINLNSDFQSLQQSNCTSCEIGADKSAYWTPILYYHHANGSFEEVPNDGMTVYYLGRGNNKTNIQPFPPGFRMLSGITSLRSYDTQTLIPGSNRPKADRVSFACLDTAPSKEQPGMTRTSCVNGLRAQIHFQSCWDGVTLYKPDNSHVEYMSDLDNGNCPSTHPVPLLHLFYEVLYSVNKIQQDGGQFTFSQGDTTGFGFHGDFLNGWDQATLKSAITDCASTNDGTVGDCPAFKATDDPKTFSQKCPEQPQLIKDEPVHGMISKLPGCIKLTSGPAPATDADMVCGAGAGGANPNQTMSAGNSSFSAVSTKSNTTSAASSGSVMAPAGSSSGAGSLMSVSETTSSAVVFAAASSAAAFTAAASNTQSASASSMTMKI